MQEIGQYISKKIYAKKGNHNGIILYNDLQITAQKKTIQKCSPTNKMV